MNTDRKFRTVETTTHNATYLFRNQSDDLIAHLASASFPSDPGRPCSGARHSSRSAETDWQCQLDRQFRLTASETRLAICLASGQSLREAARHIGVSYETVRTQLKAVFAKTNTRRQVELVLLLNKLRSSF